MNAFQVAVREILFRWKTGVMLVSVVAAITALISFFTVYKTGFNREIFRHSRDIGSNVVILPSSVDQVDYHEQGGFSEETMPEQVVRQLIEFKASLNHLIPMLEKKAVVSRGDSSATVRVVGISASIPMPGRPKAPMQKSLGKDALQLGSAVAEKLKVQRDAEATVNIGEEEYSVSRVNRETGTWQDSAVFLDLKTAQELFGNVGQLSRIEAIECTSEKCEQLGVTSDVVLTNELANITDQAQILRRQGIATARSRIRSTSIRNMQFLTNGLWLFLVVSVSILGAWNTVQRRNEIGVFNALGFGSGRILSILVLRAMLLSGAGGFLGILAGSGVAWFLSTAFFQVTGGKVTLDGGSLVIIWILAVLLSGLSTTIPALFAAGQHPANLLGKDPA